MPADTNKGGFGCCGADHPPSKDNDTNIWLRDKHPLKPIPKYKKYQSPKNKSEHPNSP
jgi:hypothetical protein